MKVVRKLAFFAFVSIFVLGIPAVIHWFTNGQWSKDFWLEVLIQSLAECAPKTRQPLTVEEVHKSFQKSTLAQTLNSASASVHLSPTYEHTK
jgi:hypothetical protein